MGNQVFTDMLVAPATVLDSQDDGKTRVRFKATQANVVNSNMRLYPLNVLNDAVNKSNELIKQSRMVGESPHPKHFVGKDGGIVFDTKLENTVIKIFNQFMDENGNVFVDAEVLDTAKGKDLKALIDAGIPVGISMRALGDGKRKAIDKVMVDVATRLDIHTYDVVMNPATPGCEIVQVLTDSQMEEVLADDVQITIPACPTCGSTLTPQDPDADGDLDFYSCDSCKEVYIPEEEKNVTYVARQSLRKLPNDPDWDGYSLARQFKMNMAKGVTDSTQKTSIEGDENEMKIEDLLKLMADSPEFQQMIEEKAKNIAKPALDAVEAQKSAEDAAKAKAALVTEKNTFVDERMAALKGKIDAKAISVIVDAVKRAENKETAEVIIDSLVATYSQNNSQAMLDNIGFDGSVPEGGQVRVNVTHEPKPWDKHMKAMADAMDREAMLRGDTIDPSIRKVNQPIVDKLVEHAEKTAKLYDGSGNVIKQGYEAMKDSAAFMDSIMNDSVSVTTTQVLNQPTISALLLQQTFQNVESLQFLNAEVFSGNEVRFMSEYYNSVATIDPSSGVLDILVPEGNGIQESSVLTSWITFNPAWRRNAISMTTDVMNTMMSGPAKYDVMSRAIYHISAEKRRLLDNLAYLEMVASSDEYQPSVISNEVASAVGSSAGQVTAVSDGTNKVYQYKVTLKGAANTTFGTNPIVRPRKKKQQGANGQVTTVTSNAVSAIVNSVTLTMGYLDSAGNIQGGSYAVDFENGIFYFTSVAAIDGTHLPTVNYSGVTNYDRWSLTLGSGYTKAEEWTNTLLTKITTVAAQMGSAPRYKRPNTAIMSMNTAALIQNATMWYKLNDPVVGRLSGLADSTNFGERSNVAFAQINAPWVGGDSRILMTQKGATKYAVETPYQIEGPFPKYDSNGNIIDAKVFYGRENSVMCTPLPVDNNGNIINPVSRTLKITN